MPDARQTSVLRRVLVFLPIGLVLGSLSAWTLPVAPATGRLVRPDAPPDPRVSQLVAPDRAQVQLESPAVVPGFGEIAPGIPVGTQDQVVSSAFTNGIPAAALAAYQLAAQVIDTADAGCNIDWPLIAAIGRVESDHGRYGGNVLSAEGVSAPGIYGIPLDGTNGTQKITDTDGGQYDNDRIFDRAVGPMQFIPSTWSVIGVDADGDGRRNPQDIDDAALGTAVYLCSGDEDLSTEEGVDAAVFRYNHSQAYVDLVKQIAAAYASGDYYAAPTASYAPTYFGPSYDDSVLGPQTRGHPGDPRPVDEGGPAASDPPREPDAAPAPPADAPPPAKPPRPRKSPTERVEHVLNQVPQAVNGSVIEVQQALAYCQTVLTTAGLSPVGGLEVCVRTVVEAGGAAVPSLLESLALAGVLGLLEPGP